jgi:hypothetical protein
MYMSNLTDEPNNLSVDEIDGIFFICDQDGPISHGGVDSGPYSTRLDAEYELDRFVEALEGWY